MLDNPITDFDRGNMTGGASILLRTGLSDCLRVSGLWGWLGLALGLVGGFGGFMCIFLKPLPCLKSSLVFLPD